jgi:hypothetical protein
MLQGGLFRLFFRTRGINGALANMGYRALEVEFEFRRPEQRASIVSEVAWFEMAR